MSDLTELEKLEFHIHLENKSNQCRIRDCTFYHLDGGRELQSDLDIHSDPDLDPQIHEFMEKGLQQIKFKGVVTECEHVSESGSQVTVEFTEFNQAEYQKILKPFEENHEQIQIFLEEALG